MHLFPDFFTVENSFLAMTPQRWNIFQDGKLSLFIEPNKSMIWLVFDGNFDVATMSFPPSIKYENRVLGGHNLLLVGIKSKNCSVEAYSFLHDVSMRFGGGGCDLVTAVSEALESWRSIIAADSMENLNAQIGLWGELWVLWKLIGGFGVECAIEYWLGPKAEQHDFSLKDFDLEVKSTVSPSRIHTISSMTQLNIIQPRSLYLVSIQLQPAGGSSDGLSLEDAIEKICGALSSNDKCLQLFKDYLKAIGFDFDLRHKYQDKYSLRSRPLVVPVDGNFPILNRNAIKIALGEALAQRVASLSYRVNVDGLGFEVGTDSADKILPSLILGDLNAR